MALWLALFVAVAIGAIVRSVRAQVRRGPAASHQRVLRTLDTLSRSATDSSLRDRSDDSHQHVRLVPAHEVWQGHRVGPADDSPPPPPAGALTVATPAVPVPVFPAATPRESDALAGTALAGADVVETTGATADAPATGTPAPVMPVYPASGRQGPRLRDVGLADAAASPT